MSTKKLSSTLSGSEQDISTRICDFPLLRPSDIVPSDPRLRVIGVLNPTFIKIGIKKYLIVRVDERPSNMNASKNNNIGNIDPLLVAYADLEYAGKVEIVQTQIQEKYSGDMEPILPKSVREFRLGLRQQELLLSYISHLRIFEMIESGFEITKSPFLFPCDIFSQYGCEDPRATIIEGQPLLLYTAIGQYGATAWSANIQNKSICDKKIILGPDHKHTTIFPEKINDYYFLLTRPLSRSYLRSSGIWMLRSPDMVHWGVPTPVIFPRAGMWDEVRVGPSASPILTNDGWLLLYYGVDCDQTYRVGAVLLDKNDPSKIIARTSDPILSPILEWERVGRRADTVFPCGVEVIEKLNSLRIYYGAADTCIGAADVDQKDLIRKLI